MLAPKPSLILATPPPLNPFTRFPFFVNEFPADILFGLSAANLAPRQEPGDAPENSNRKEQR